MAKLESQIAEIHDVMVDNIGALAASFTTKKITRFPSETSVSYYAVTTDKLLARREKINLLVDRTGELCQDALEFRRRVRYCLITHFYPLLPHRNAFAGTS